MSTPRLFRPAAVALALGGAALIPAVAPAAAQPASADVDDFDYTSWDARYELSLDEQGRAILHAEEHVVAGFPDTDQNKGIVRGFATRYQGADLGTTIMSVTDADGEPVPYELDDDDDTIYVLTGTDEYVHGPADYVIEYRMRDVMLTADDTGADEFYWDLLPLDNTQDIDRFRAEIVIAPALSARLDGNVACYRGEPGSQDACEMAGPRRTSDGAVFTVASDEVRAGEGVTVALGFQPGTVTQPEARHPNALLDVGPALSALGAAALAAGGWFAVLAHLRRRRRATGIVIAQYDVPASLPPLIAAHLLVGPRSTIAAEIVHLAVRGNLRIEDRAEGQPVLHKAEAPVGDPMDQRMLDALFRARDTTSFTLPSASEAFAKRMTKLQARAQEETAARGLATTERSPLAIVLLIISALVLAGTVALTVMSGIQGRESLVGSVVAAVVAGIIVLVSAVYAFSRHRVLTRAGAEQHEYLQGVREFIRVAESERIRMLQSYSGAERYTRDGKELIHLYERLLPYAILFGMEKEWGEVLATRFAENDDEPQWMTGFQAGYFAHAIARFGSQTASASTYSAPSTSSSSSSSGSFGGGFVGGGGGGGFSGGR